MNIETFSDCEIDFVIKSYQFIFIFNLIPNRFSVEYIYWDYNKTSLYCFLF